LGAKARPNAEPHAINYIIDASQIELPVAVNASAMAEGAENYIGTARVEASDDLKNGDARCRASLVYLVQGQTRLQQAGSSSRRRRRSITGSHSASNARRWPMCRMDAPALRGGTATAIGTRRGHPGATPGEIEFDLGVRAPVDRIRLIVNQSQRIWHPYASSREPMRVPSGVRSCRRSLTGSSARA